MPTGPPRCIARVPMRRFSRMHSNDAPTSPNCWQMGRARRHCCSPSSRAMPMSPPHCGANGWVSRWCSQSETLPVHSISKRSCANSRTFADRALHAALEAAIRKRVPDAEPIGMIGLALGKHGAGELNYSSDIDPILLYDPETLPRRQRDEPGEAAQRYARETVRLLSEVTSEGYVFRVDLRLRPASEVSPLALPLEAAITHYESSALAWERAAYIRARACAGDIAAGEAFLDQYPALRLAAEPRFRRDRRNSPTDPSHSRRTARTGDSRTWLQSQARPRGDPRGPSSSRRRTS